MFEPSDSPPWDDSSELVHPVDGIILWRCYVVVFCKDFSVCAVLVITAHPASACGVTGTLVMSRFISKIDLAFPDGQFRTQPTPLHNTFSPRRNGLQFRPWFALKAPVGTAARLSPTTLSLFAYLSPNSYIS